MKLDLCGKLSGVGLGFVVVCDSVTLLAASATIRIGYPQPSGAMLPIWVTAQTKLDQKYGIVLQNVYISGGARFTQTLVSGDIELAATGGAVINAVLSGADLTYVAASVPTTEEQVRSILAVADHPKAAAADPKEFFDNRFMMELEESDFVRELYGLR